MSLAVSPVSPAVSLVDIRAHLNYEDGDHTDDVELQFFLDAAIAWVGTQLDDLTPAPVQLAVRELVRHWWDTQRGPASGPLDDGEPATATGLGYAIPPRVKELIGPYQPRSTASSATGSFPDPQDWPDPVRR